MINLSKIADLITFRDIKRFFSVYLRSCIKKYTWVNFVWLKNTSTLIVIWRVDWKYLLIHLDNTQHFRQIRSPFIKCYITNFNLLTIFQLSKLPWLYISNSFSSIISCFVWNNITSDKSNKIILYESYLKSGI